MSIDAFKKIFVENQERIPELNVFQRDYAFQESANYILTGQRRAGKTFLLYYRSLKGYRICNCNLTG